MTRFRWPALVLSGVTVVALLAAFLPGPVAVGAGQSTGTRFQLVSVGSDGTAATADSGQPALAADGEYTAFVSASDLPVSASVTQKDAANQYRVYVRNRLSGTTTLVGDQPGDDTTAPSISGNGRLVAYQDGVGAVREGQIDVVDREATGQGPFDAPGNLVATQVTDNAADPHYQHILACPFHLGAGTGPVHCGPQLSADGSTLAYPALLSPVASGLARMIDDPEEGLNADGDMLDFVPSNEMLAGGNAMMSESLSYANDDSTAIQFLGPPTVRGPFEIDSINCGNGETTTFGTLQPHQVCTLSISVNLDQACRAAGATAEVSGDLITDSLTPDGQSDTKLVAGCLMASATAPVGCAVPPAGLPVQTAPTAGTDNHGTPLVDFGPVQAGAPVVEQVPVTGTGKLTFTTADCALQLIDPSTAQLNDPVSPGLPAPCQQGEQLGRVVTGGEEPTSCTGYVLVDPQQVAPSAALLTVGPTAHAVQSTYLSVTGVRSVVVVRHGPDFATSPGVVASVDAAGTPLPGAGQPSLSATGRYLAFSAAAPSGPAGVGTEVWRHDTDQSGSTELVSCLPGDHTCQPATDAGAPAISGNGSRIAFTGSSGSGPSQVYVRDTGAGGTRLVSSTEGLGATAGDLPSVAPAISQDGSTVAFDSTARNLLTQPTSDAATNIYLVELGPGSTALAAVSSAGGGLADGSTLAEPSLDAHGRLVAFPGEANLTPAAPSDVDSVYTFERFGPVSADPAAVGFGSLSSGSPAQRRGITVTDTGPGPTMVTGVGLTGPYRMVTDTCQQAVLHAEQQCQLLVEFTPTTDGGHPGRLTVTTGDDGEADGDLTVELTATVIAASGPLLTVSPSVAIGGEVVHATGIAFPAKGPVTLSWRQGIGTVVAVANASGGFTADLVIQPDDELGERTLAAAGPTGKVLATRTFLVDPSPQEPPFHKGP